MYHTAGTHASGVPREEINGTPAACVPIDTLSLSCFHAPSIDKDEHP